MNYSDDGERHKDKTINTDPISARKQRKDCNPANGYF